MRVPNPIKVLIKLVSSVLVQVGVDKQILSSKWVINKLVRAYLVKQTSARVIYKLVCPLLCTLAHEAGQRLEGTMRRTRLD